jgi:hypothetical protein
MSINYSAAYLHAEFWKENIIPYLRHLSPPTTFSDYLAAFYHTQTPDKTYGIPLSYIYSLEFLKKYQGNCVTFQYNSPEDVAKGSAVLSGVYQFSPSLHGMVNISLWHDEGKNRSDAHITTFLVYERLSEVLDFVNDNLSIVKQEEKTEVGFATARSYNED